MKAAFYEQYDTSDALNKKTHHQRGRSASQSTCIFCKFLGLGPIT
jgi:hypothetical protein